LPFIGDYRLKALQNATTVRTVQRREAPVEPLVARPPKTASVRRCRWLRCAPVRAGDASMSFARNFTGLSGWSLEFHQARGDNFRQMAFLGYARRCDRFVDRAFAQRSATAGANDGDDGRRESHPTRHFNHAGVTTRMMKQNDKPRPSPKTLVFHQREIEVPPDEPSSKSQAAKDGIRCGLLANSTTMS